MKLLWEIADFARAVRRQMRFGELSRAPLRLIRLELRGNCVECEWMVRPTDKWDADLRRQQIEQINSQQALRDAVAMRDLVFASLSDVDQAVLRAFRHSPGREPPQLVIAGYVSRSDPEALRLSSWAMKAKLYGFRFDLDDGILQALDEPEGTALQVMQEATLNA